MSVTEHRWEVMEYKYLLTVLYLSEFFFYSWSLQLYTNIWTFLLFLLALHWKNRFITFVFNRTQC